MFAMQPPSYGDDEKEAKVTSFIDELAQLYAALWLAGRLDEIRQDECDERFDEE